MSDVLQPLLSFVLDCIADVGSSPVTQTIVAVFMAEFIWLIAVRLIKHEY